MPNQAIPENVGKKEFYVDQDWRLPMAYLWLDPNNDKDSDAPFFLLKCGFVMREVKVKKWKPFFSITENKLRDVTDYNEAEVLSPLSNDEPPYRWSLWSFQFQEFAVLINLPTLNQNGFVLDKNPGNYELKNIA